MTVYTQILKRLWPGVPVVIGGVEASLRRLTHYDYWDDRLMPSILVDSGADWLCYGMGERPMLELTRAIETGRNRRQIEQIPQLAFFRTGRISAVETGKASQDRGHPWPRKWEGPADAVSGRDERSEVLRGFSGGTEQILLHSYEKCCEDKRAFAENFREIEIQARP